jgi:biopolymer transport protein ExbD
MSMVGASQDDAVMAEINITPFTDVLLVLLIIFMILAALTTPPGFEKKLPDSNPNAPVTQQNKKDKSVEVVVSKLGVIFIDGRESKGDAIYNDLQNVESRRGKETHISLTADIKAPYGLVIKVLDAAKAAGLNDVAFVTS